MQFSPGLRKKFLYKIFVLLAWFSGFSLYGEASVREELPDTLASLAAAYRHAADDSLRVVYLLTMARFCNDYLEDAEKADSLAETAIRIAEMNYRPALLIYAYNAYIESVDNDLYYTKSLSYANKALQNCRITGNIQMQWRTCKNLAKTYVARYDFNNAFLSGNEALSLANTLKNDTLVAESYLYIGNSLGYKNQKIQAFRNFLMAKDMAVKIGDPRLLRKCYAQLYSFYYYNKLYDEALDSKRKEGRTILEISPVDSTALMWVQYDLHSIEVSQKKGTLNEQSVKAVIDFAIRTGNNRLKTWEFALYRRHLLELDDIKKLHRFFIRTYPDDFRQLSDIDPGMYFRLKAFFAEYEGKPDSADYYFNKAEELIIGARDKNNLFKSNFYSRYGQFLTRQGLNVRAIGKFTTAISLAEANEYPGRFEFMLIPCKNLEALYSKAGNFKMAWYYASLSHRVLDSISKNTENDQIMAESVRQERSQKEMAAEKDRLKIRQGKTQRNMFAGAGAFFIIVSLLIYRNYRNQKKLNRLLDEAKQKSDDLLLNILPVETAEELKMTGKASAKRFDEVTVMFTDFKNFTQASEQMSAEKLVTELNFYYSEFDSIISRHNIEKIKIIGDSYMCAGGLPVVNERHALDVVAAALELQKFILARKAEKSASGESFFELRIGIHTGPVVAGIVGHKKFAYDIWGDTVNTASRMENAGETNKINISGATYEKVKDQFDCTYRGKVEAKHKGLVDMYFVDAVKS